MSRKECEFCGSEENVVVCPECDAMVCMDCCNDETFCPNCGYDLEDELNEIL